MDKKGQINGSTNCMKNASEWIYGILLRAQTCLANICEWKWEHIPAWKNVTSLLLSRGGAHLPHMALMAGKDATYKYI